MLIEGYFDESGDFDEEPKVFCISGYYLVSEAAKEMHEKWGEVLARHNIPYFHMVDCAHGTDAFAGMEKDERTEIVKEFIDLIKKYTLAGVSVIVREEDFEASDKHPDAYSSCVAHCVTALQVFLHVSRIEGDMAYFFESGHKNRGRAFKHVAETLEKLSAPLTFAPKEQVRLLQAADLLAWQSSKYVKDRISKKRPPRKDFMSLMEHPHSFAHVTLKDGGGIGFEDWPISRRSPTSTTLSISCDGPVVFLYEDGEQAPIVAIDRAIGWRMGGGRMAYAKFKTLGDNKELVLAFDEPRLYEAIHTLIGTMGIYAGSNMGPLLPATEILVDAAEGASVLCVQLPNGANINIHLPDEATERLRARLGETKE